MDAAHTLANEILGFGRQDSLGNGLPPHRRARRGPLASAAVRHRGAGGLGRSGADDESAIRSWRGGARDGKVYAVGGASIDAPLNSVERYVPAANAWEAVAPMASVRADPACVSI